jgi:hypothetical protein
LAGTETRRLPATPTIPPAVGTAEVIWPGAVTDASILPVARFALRFAFRAGP